MRRTGAAGSPQTSPTASQSRAHAGSYICSRTLTTWARVGVFSLVTTTTIVAALPREAANVNCSLCLDYAQLMSCPVRPTSGRLGPASARRTLGGPGRVRTDDTRGVSAVLCQLSYRPLDVRHRYSAATASRYAESGRASPGPFTMLQRRTPEVSTRKVPRTANPIAVVEHPVRLGDLAVRPEVGQQRELVLLGLRPGALRVHRVARDAERAGRSRRRTGRCCRAARRARPYRCPRRRTGRRRAPRSACPRSRPAAPSGRAGPSGRSRARARRSAGSSVDAPRCWAALAVGAGGRLAPARAGGRQPGARPVAGRADRARRVQARGRRGVLDLRRLDVARAARLGREQPDDAPVGEVRQGVDQGVDEVAVAFAPPVERRVDDVLRRPRRPARCR